WAVRAAATIGACMLAASASHAAAVTGASGFAAWSATRAGAGELEPLVSAPGSAPGSIAVAAASAVLEQPRSNDSNTVAATGVTRRSPAPSLQRPRRKHAVDDPAREWEPLRSVGDVNVLHVAAALAWSLLTFALGMWIGRRRTQLVAPAAVSAAVSGSAA